MFGARCVRSSCERLVTRHQRGFRTPKKSGRTVTSKHGRMRKTQTAYFSAASPSLRFGTASKGSLTPRFATSLRAGLTTNCDRGLLGISCRSTRTSSWNGAGWWHEAGNIQSRSASLISSLRPPRVCIPSLSAPETRLTFAWRMSRFSIRGRGDCRRPETLSAVRSARDDGLSLSTHAAIGHL